MLFQDQDIGVETGKTDCGGEPGKTAADDNQGDRHRSGVFQQRLQIVDATVQ